MKHWSEIFGNMVTAREIVEVAWDQDMTIEDYLRNTYAELNAENPEGIWKPERAPQFNVLANQIMQEFLREALQL